MYKQVLQHIDGIDIYPVISLVIFFTFFLGLIFWIFTIKKSYITKMSHLPLESSGDNSMEVQK